MEIEKCLGTLPHKDLWCVYYMNVFIAYRSVYLTSSTKIPPAVFEIISACFISLLMVTFMFQGSLSSNLCMCLLFWGVFLYQFWYLRSCKVCVKQKGLKRPPVCPELVHVWFRVAPSPWNLEYLLYFCKHWTLWTLATAFWWVETKSKKGVLPR